MYLFLVNPEAGNKAFTKVRKPMTDFLDQLHVPYNIVEITDLDNVPALLDKHLNTKVKGVAAVGGNATVNAVINSLSSEDLPVAIIPLSRTNHLAKSLGIRNWRDGIKTLVNPQIKETRLGKAGKHYFIGKLDIVSQLNLLTKYLPRTNFIYRFLGLQPSIMVNDLGVKSTITIDEDLEVSARVQRLHIELNEKKEEKKLSLELYTRSGTESVVSRFEADTVNMDSARKLHVLMGNEAIGYTPLEIKGLSKYIKLIIPAPKLATKE